MREITVLSGKGGAGKTSITAALASLCPEAIYCDNDVDASDLHLIFSPQKEQSYPFEYGWEMTIDPLKCNGCQLCESLCRFQAIHVNKDGKAEMKLFKCEGCRLCERSCPQKAISAKVNRNNHWFISSTRFGYLVHAEMGVGEENSGKLVSLIRKESRALAKQQGIGYVINDGPPGIGCSTIASITGTHAVLVVIETSESGWHDAIRVLELAKKWDVPTYAIINKVDINPVLSEKINLYLKKKHIPLLASIPWSKEFVESMERQQNIIEYSQDNVLKASLQNVWDAIK
ncbi:ATP-binding protein [Prolixibacteraceae bacterium]|nr:ATP-binding protein [Prolixibacteraceae bacterium]